MKRKLAEAITGNYHGQSAVERGPFDGDEDGQFFCFARVIQGKTSK